HQAIALATGDSRKEGHPSDLTDSHPSTGSPLPPLPEAKPQPSAIVEDRAAETTEAGSEEGEVQLIVSPFSSFGAVNRFTSALRSVPGVSSATIRRFQKGRLQVSVDYAGVVPLGHRLEELNEFRVFSEFRLRVIESSQGRLEALIESSEEPGRGSPSGVQQ
ncbi:MAG: hypothetical protein Q8P59_05250, partial [Dehalococcoidia bacterium]|nr:hypothetical protein [Dehalococcoidia bacterium]